MKPATKKTTSASTRAKRNGKPIEPREQFAVKMAPIGAVTPYARNPRKNDAAVAKVAGSLKEFGWRQPIVVDDSMTVIAGHTRLLAARQLGMASVPIHVAHGLTAAQVKAYRLADNRVAEDADWDAGMLGLELGDLELAGFDLALTGFEPFEIRRVRGEFDRENDPNAEWQGMPEFAQDDKTAFRRVVVHFRDQTGVDAFAKLVKQHVTPETRFVWFPEIEIERYANKRYTANADSA